MNTHPAVPGGSMFLIHHQPYTSLRTRALPFPNALFSLNIQSG